MIGGLEPRGAEDSTPGATSQYVAFPVDDQSHCVDIMSVRATRAWTGTTPLPNTPAGPIGWTQDKPIGESDDATR